MIRNNAVQIAATVSCIIVSAVCLSNTASADPPGFPDLGGFTEVPVGPYIAQAGKDAPTVSFSTREGINCRFGAPKAPDGQNQLGSCDGPFPGLQNLPATGTGPCEYGTANEYGIGRIKGSCKDFKPIRKILNPGEKISYGNVTCAVGDGPLLACIDRFGPERGFVLQPSGSFSF